MRLVFCLFNYFPHSGLCRDMLRIAAECRRREHQVYIVAGAWEGARPDGVEVEVLGHRGLSNHGRAHAFYRRLWAALEDRSFDLVVGFNKMPGLDAYYCADNCFVDKAARRHPVWYRCTGRYRLYSRFEREVFGVASRTHILSISPRLDKLFRQHYLTPDHRFHALPAGIDPARREALSRLPSRDQIRQSLGLKSRQLMLLFAGSGFRTKGLDRVLRAMAALPAALRERTGLLIAGRDAPDAYVQQATALGIGRQVQFLGGRDDIPELMRAADLLVHPAYYETTGTVILEAIVSGLPVLASRACGFAEHVEAADAGQVLSRIFSQTEMNTRLAAMLTSDRRVEWRSNGMNYGTRPELYAMPRVAVDVIEKLCESRDPVSNSCSGASTGNLYVGESLRHRTAGRSGFDDFMSISGEIYRQGPARETLRFEREGNSYYIKKHDGVGWPEIIKNLSYLRLPVTGAGNEWHGAHRVSDLGLDTFTVAAFGSRGANPATRRSFIVTEALPGCVSLEDCADAWRSAPVTAEQVARKRWIIERVASIARTLHADGVNHRDFYLCHFLFDAGGETFDPDRARIYLIDLHRMQIRRQTPPRWAVKDIAGLYFSAMTAGLTRTDKLRFVKHYSGTSPRGSLRGDARFWTRVQRRAEKMYTADKHG